MASSTRSATPLKSAGRLAVQCAGFVGMSSAVSKQYNCMHNCQKSSPCVPHVIIVQPHTVSRCHIGSRARCRAQDLQVKPKLCTEILDAGAVLPSFVPRLNAHNFADRQVARRARGRAGGDGLQDWIIQKRQKHHQTGSFNSLLAAFQT